MFLFARKPHSPLKGWKCSFLCVWLSGPLPPSARRTGGRGESVAHPCEGEAGRAGQGAWSQEPPSSLSSGPRVPGAQPALCAPELNGTDVCARGAARISRAFPWTTKERPNLGHLSSRGRLLRMQGNQSCSRTASVFGDVGSL